MAHFFSPIHETSMSSSDDPFVVVLRDEEIRWHNFFLLFMKLPCLPLMIRLLHHRSFLDNIRLGPELIRAATWALHPRPLRVVLNVLSPPAFDRKARRQLWSRQRFLRWELRWNRQNGTTDHRLCSFHMQYNVHRPCHRSDLRQ